MAQVVRSPKVYDVCIIGSGAGGGGRSEKIRTYNYKENRLTDHRIPITLHSLDRVLDGELDDVVDALAADERSRQLGGE